MARRFAILETPIARVTVNAAGSPSGIAPTASAMAPINVSTTGCPRSTPTPNVTADKMRMATSSTRLNWLILRVSGVSNSVALEINCDIRPISLPSPVATTTPVAVPYVTSVEA